MENKGGLESHIELFKVNLPASVDERRLLNYIIKDLLQFSADLSSQKVNQYRIIKPELKKDD